MEIHQLRTLRELRDRGSVTAAAQALGMSPSAVSQQLAALQRSVAVPLTQMHGRILRLTKAGERLAAAGGVVVEAMANAEQSVADYLASNREPVTVTAFHSAGLAWFPPLIESCLADPDGPQVSCRDEDVAVAEFPELAADYDIVIAHRPFDSASWPRDRVRVVPLLAEPIDLALNRGHRLASSPEIALADLGHEAWLCAHEGFALEPLLLQAQAASTGASITISQRVNEFNVAAAIVARTDIVCLLPRYTGLIPYFQDDVVLRPIGGISGVTLGRRIDILARPEALARASVHRVVERITQIARSTATPAPRPSL